MKPSAADTRPLIRLRNFARHLRLAAEEHGGSGDGWIILGAALLLQRFAGKDCTPRRLSPRLTRFGDLLAPAREILDEKGFDDLWSVEGPYVLPRLYAMWRSLQSRRGAAPGSHLTPQEIGRPLVREVLRLWWKHHPTTPPGILDPACGSGAFLLWSATELHARRCREEEDLSAGAGVLYGVDIDPVALEICRLALAAARKTGAAEPFPEFKLICGNVLSAAVFGGKTPEFDLVIGNPPWVSLKGRFRTPALSEKELADLVERYGASGYRPNLAELFIWRGLELLRPGGLLAFVVPDRIAANLQFENLRRLLLQHTRILELTFGLAVPGVVSDVMTMVLEKREPESRHRVAIHSHGTTARTSQRSFLNRPSARWGQPAAAQSAPWLKDTVHLGELVKTAVGFIARKGTITGNRIGREQISVVRGRDITRYSHRGRGYFEFGRGNLAGGTQDARKLGASPKILVRKTGRRLIATLDESGDFPEQSLYLLFDPAGGVSLSVLLAWLNSETLGKYVADVLLTNRDSIAQIKKVDLDRIPVPNEFIRGKGIARWSREVERLVRKRIDAGQGNDGVHLKKIEDEIESVLLARLKLL